MKVQEVMCRPVESCRLEDDLNRPAQLMWDHDFGAVPVVDGTGAVVGMITDRDVCMAAYLQGRSLSAIRVQEVISGSLESCSPGTSLEAALSIMKDARVRRLPVIDAEGALAGILSLCDLAREADRAHRRGEDQLSDAVTAALATIAEPRFRVPEFSRVAEPQAAARPPAAKVRASAV